MRAVICYTLLSIMAGCLVVGSFNIYLDRYYQDRVYTVDSVSSHDFSVAIVFGAGVWENQEPSPVLYDRIETGALLYKKGIVKKLLLTGDNRFHHYNEVAVMSRVAQSLGVPEGDLILDYAGRRSYDSCCRARHIFHVEKAIVVSQAFHVTRCLYLCEALGVEAIAVKADRQPYFWYSKARWWLRENVATAVAWYNLQIKSPKVIL